MSKILLVEDDSNFVTACRRYLRKGGFTDVDDAYRGNEALTRIGDQYDVVILDTDLPGLDGPEVAREARSLGYGGRIIGMSGESVNEEKWAKPDDGFYCDRFLLKGNIDDDPGLLPRTVTELLESI
ncbi:MAG: response regulator [Candidatus Aenigmatarchaeota archaeon]